MLNDIKYKIREIKKGFQNFWKYKEIIWNDRWFDYSFTIELIKFKLQDNINNWDKSHYVGSDFTKKRMQVILNRIQEFETNLDNLAEMLIYKKITKEQYKIERKKIISKTWNTFGRNIQKFWD